MSSVEKANKFIKEAERHGWATKWKKLSSQDGGFFRVTATRKAETIVIEWAGNQLNGSPLYRLHDMDLKIHSTKDAYRKLAATKPDMDQYHKWQRRSKPKPVGLPVAGHGNDVSEPVADIAISLPFDIDEDPDSVILKAIRGNTIVYKNSYTGEAESVHVPWRIKDGRGGVRVFNHDTENVFYLAVGETTGRAFVSFMDSNGQFRAVHLDRLIGVV